MIRTRLAAVALALALANTAACTHVNRATLIASTAALACDWAQTRSFAERGWALRSAYGGDYLPKLETNPIMGTAPSPMTVDLYFAGIAIANVALYLVVPESYRWLAPAVLTVSGARAIQNNNEKAQDWNALLAKTPGRETLGFCGM